MRYQLSVKLRHVQDLSSENNQNKEFNSNYMGNSNTTTEKQIHAITPEFYNIRTSFKLFKGIVDIGTHMSLIKLSSGKYLVIDTVPLDDELKQELDQLTNNGNDIEAVVATHPFHTLAFPGFYKAYPNVPYYGTPRHLRIQKDIPWAGNIMNELDRWAPDVQMRIPAGAEFVAPQPESYNHFTCVWVFSTAARTIHVDDTINYVDTPSLLFKLAGKKAGQMEFHMSIKGPGLYPTEDAPVQFKQWVLDILRDWDFDNACCAHVGRKIGGAHALLERTLKEAQPLFDKLIKRHQGKLMVDLDDGKDCAQYNVNGNECG
jgi:hypothetical protein